MTLDKQIVIAHYIKPIAWAEALQERGYNVLCYSKGPEHETTLPQVRVPNVGLDGYCYLTHIIDRWDDLADYTLFCQDWPFDHLPAGMTPESLLDHPADFVPSRLWTGREWDVYGRLIHWGPYLDRLRSGAMRRAERSMASWFRDLFGVHLYEIAGLTYVVGANFVASRRLIQRQPISLYRRVRDTVSHHREPEEAYYVERAWGILLTANE